MGGFVGTVEEQQFLNITSIHRILFDCDDLSRNDPTIISVTCFVILRGSTEPIAKRWVFEPIHVEIKDLHEGFL
jgi:hypothetical protein